MAYQRHPPTVYWKLGQGTAPQLTYVFYFVYAYEAHMQQARCLAVGPWRVGRPAAKRMLSMLNVCSSQSGQQNMPAQQMGS